MEATQKSKQQKKTKKVKKRVSGKPQVVQEEEEVLPDESRYVGCFASESSFQGTV